MQGFYHFAFVVPSLRDATNELSEVLGIVWSPVRNGRLGDWDYRIVFSVEGPPFIEVIEGPAGSPWDATTGPRFDHIGCWSHDITQDKAALIERAVPVQFDACPYGRSFTYHRLESLGVRLELVDVSLRPEFLATWAPTNPPMPVLDLGRNEAG